MSIALVLVKEKLVPENVLIENVIYTQEKLHYASNRDFLVNQCPFP